MRSWGREDGGDLGVRKERIQFRINGSIFSVHHLAGCLAVVAGMSGGVARVWGGRAGAEERGDGSRGG